MKYLLDTNVLSDVRKQVRPELNTWLAGQLRADVAISVVSLLEIERGVLGIERRDRPAGAHLRSWLENDIPAAFQGTVLSIDERVASRAAGLHVPDPMPELDVLIAATARAHGLTLVTRNVKDFQRADISLLNSWEL